MRGVIIFISIFLPIILLGQEPTWNLTKVNKKGKLKYEYHLHVLLTLEPTDIELASVNDTLNVLTQMPEVYEVHSMNELTEYEKESILTCILENPSNFNSACSEKKKYQILMQI